MAKWATDSVVSILSFSILLAVLFRFLSHQQIPPGDAAVLELKPVLHMTSFMCIV